MQLMVKCYVTELGIKTLNIYIFNYNDNKTNKNNHCVRFFYF